MELSEIQKALEKIQFKMKELEAEKDSIKKSKAYKSSVPIPSQPEINYNFVLDRNVIRVRKRFKEVWKCNGKEISGIEAKEINLKANEKINQIEKELKELAVIETQKIQRKIELELISEPAIINNSESLEKELKTAEAISGIKSGNKGRIFKTVDEAVSYVLKDKHNIIPGDPKSRIKLQKIKKQLYQEVKDLYPAGISYGYFIKVLSEGKYTERAKRNK